MNQYPVIADRIRQTIRERRENEAKRKKAEEEERAKKEVAISVSEQKDSGGGSMMKSRSGVGGFMRHLSKGDVGRSSMLRSPSKEPGTGMMRSISRS
ncbi:hypothetical protein HK104_005830 [Borealophlyctis nickersoniae]|nr:hypothetical protein HK104_005830 [Borealophlyctis nickersoniae]